MAQIEAPESKREQPLEQVELPQESCDAHHSGSENSALFQREDL